MPNNNNRQEISDALIKQDLEYIARSVNKIEKKLEDDYVTKTEFDPIQRLVYGMVGLVMVTVLGALLAMVVIR